MKWLARGHITINSFNLFAKKSNKYSTGSVFASLDSCLLADKAAVIRRSNRICIIIAIYTLTLHSLYDNWLCKISKSKLRFFFDGFGAFLYPLGWLVLYFIHKCQAARCPTSGLDQSIIT